MPSPDGDSLPFRTLLAWHSGGGPEARAAVARRLEEWTAMWRDLAPQTDGLPLATAVDWSTEMVLLVALGDRPTSGYAVQIEHVRAGDGLIEIHACEREPGPACVVLEVETDPFQTVVVPTRAGDVRVIMRVDTVDCD